MTRVAHRTMSDFIVLLFFLDANCLCAHQRMNFESQQMQHSQGNVTLSCMYSIKYTIICAIASCMNYV